MSATRTNRWIAVAVTIALPLATITAGPCVAAAQTRSEVNAVRAAEVHFKRGVELYGEGNAEAALVEFRRAYEMAPRFQILFNLGQVAYALNDYAGAVDYFREYLNLGDDKVPDDRKASVQEDIRRLRGRVGRLSVTCNVAGATVMLDDAPVGRTPFPPLNVNIGRRKIGVVSADGATQVRVVDVAAGELTNAHFVLAPLSRAQPLANVERAPQRPSSQGLSASTWVAWSASGALAVGAAVFGALALGDARDLDRMKETYPLASADELREQEQRASQRALLADGLLAGAAASAIVALLLTFSSHERTAEPRPANRLSLNATAGSAALMMRGGF